MAQTPFGNEAQSKSIEDFSNAEFELTEEDGRNRIRSQIYKTLVEAEDAEDLRNSTYPPNVLTKMIEEELFAGIKDCEKAVYKSGANNIVKRLTGARFSEARRQLSEGDFSIGEFIKGKNPKPQRRPQPSKQNSSNIETTPLKGPAPINRSRGVRPPIAAGRGGPPIRGARGRGVTGRGGLNQTVEPMPSPALDRNDSNTAFSENKEEDEINEEAKQQPAIQVPREEKSQFFQNEEIKKTEGIVQEQNEKVVIPPIRQQPEEIKINEITENKEQKVDTFPPQMPKTSHRRGQPPPGNHNAPPPQVIRPIRGVPMAREKGGAALNQRVPLIQNQPKLKETIQIDEDEIVHEEEKKNVHMDSSTSKEDLQEGEISPIADISQPAESQIDFKITKSKNFEESENKKREAKAMFGKIFENDGSDRDNRGRGRSPNFTEQRYAQYDGNSEDFMPKTQSKYKKPKTHRKNQDLNKSVEIFASVGNRIETEPSQPEANNILNTSFGVENTSELQEGNDFDEPNNSNNIFTANEIEDNIMRSKTPSVEAKRHKLQHEPNEDSAYHKKIGAKEDFIIEKPVMEPIRDDSYIHEDEIEEAQNQEEEVDHTDRRNFDDVKTPFIRQKIQEKSKTEENKTEKEEEIKDNKRKEMLYDDEEEYKSKSKALSKFKDSSNTEYGSLSGISMNDKRITSIGSYRKDLTANKGDQQPTISHTSSVKSIPDDLERVSENLKNKKQECEELKRQLEEKVNELSIQTQIIERLKRELEKEKASRRSSNTNSKLEAENKELWEVINQMKKEQESYKNSIFLTFKTLSAGSNFHSDLSLSFAHPQMNREESKEEEMMLHMNEDQVNLEGPIQSLEVPKNNHLETMTQEMMNNAAGSGSNQEDYNFQEKANEGEDDEEVDYEHYEEEYNEEGTSGGNAKSISHDKEFRRHNFDPAEGNIEADDRVIQGNERRGRQKQSKKRRGHKQNAYETGRDS
jgi:hypothetical protein